MNYVALQVKTSYSLLKSMNKIKNLVKKAKELGYTSLAITDTNNMFGVAEFYKECKNNQIKPIIGIELTINDIKILLYAINNDGYKNLIKLATIKSEEELTIEILKKYKDNLLLIIPYKYYNEEIYNIYEKKFIGYANSEERNNIKEKKVFINDVSYIDENDYKYLDYLLMIKENKTLGTFELGKEKNKHLLTEEEIKKISPEEDILNTHYISEICDVEINYNNDILPIYDEEKDPYEYLKYLCIKGLRKRLNDKVEEKYLKRLELELKIIKEMNFCNYFLVVWDYVKYAKQNNILVGPGRGSAAGSLVSYVLGIIDIDPLKYDLLFERFLNPERITMPDIDVDFESDKRQEVIDYVIKKYGNKKVTGIITFDTLAAKQIIRDISRIMEIPINKVDEICNLITETTLKESYLKNIKLKRLVDNDNEIKKIFKISEKLEGLPRNIGIHASGIVMSRINIDEIIPLYKSNKGMYISGYSMNYLEPLGLLKMDFLGISNLSLISDVINNIRQNEKINITFSNIPMNDKKVFEIFKEDKLDGIFQFESRGIRSFIKKLNPDSFDDLIAALALYRPGAMDYIDNYIKRKEGKEKITYIHNDLIPILKNTYGIIIYQEQIMQIARIIAGYSLGEADILRRAISKKNEKMLLDEKPKFINKAKEKGYSEDVAIKIYDLILKFGDYGFNKSHSVGYATISYKMAFLKRYFPKYFEMSLLNNCIGNDEKTNKYLQELKINKIKIIPPDINKSVDKYIVENNEVICPISIIKNIGLNTTKEIIKEREKGQYKSFIDFVIRTYNKGINKKTLNLLIISGCFNNLGYNTKTLINNLDIITNYVDLYEESGINDLIIPELVEYEEYNNQELLTIQKKSFGIYISNHPVSTYKKEDNINTNNIKKYFNKYIRMVLIIDSIKEITTKNNDIMAFIKASDEFGQISITLFPNTYKIYQKTISKDNIIEVKGQIERRFDEYQLIVKELKILK